MSGDLHWNLRDDEHVRPPCTMCGGEGDYIGQLGQHQWYRCEACGWDFTEQEIEEP